MRANNYCPDRELYEHYEEPKECKNCDNEGFEMVWDCDEDGNDVLVKDRCSFCNGTGYIQEDL